MTVTTPWGIKVRAHKTIAGVFLEACAGADRASAWTPQRIDSYNDRPIRGTDEWSLHSWAMAWDFFATPPNVSPPGGVWTPHNGLPADFARPFIERGFTWGASFSRKDVPHIEWAGALPSAPLKVATVSLATQPQTESRVTITNVGEVELVRVHTVFVQWEALDGQGRGYVDVPYPLERVLSVEGQGSYPPVDGYWPAITCTVNGRGPVTVVTLAGAPGQGGGVYARVLLDD